MAMSRPLIKVYLSPKELENWKAFCKEKKVSCSDMLRQAIRKLSGNAPQSPAQFSVVVEQPEKAKRRIHLRLTESEYEKVAACAAADGTSIARWYVFLTRARLLRDPQLGMPELAAVGESNRQLVAIGTNLNQVTRRLNMMHGAANDDSLQVAVAGIDDFRQEVKSHLDLVNALLLANRERWGIR
ncbi:MAG: plasmid mobilization relaxosome protein MobC [Proteobacteria bacterium]|nr:plasmid mobilization relaxosome protein MobC [Pseudomonadota bacterium]